MNREMREPLREEEDEEEEQPPPHIIIIIIVVVVIGRRPSEKEKENEREKRKEKRENEREREKREKREGVENTINIHSLLWCHHILLSSVHITFCVVVYFELKKKKT